jgi:hypothetical protein
LYNLKISFKFGFASHLETCLTNLKLMRIITTILLAAGILSAEAQKLPAVQQVAVKLPAGIKIDGKADEWADRFEAYNPATELWYTIANDDKRLYLILRANSQNIYGVVNRILASGLTFTIVNNKTKYNKGLSVTYPVKSDSQIQFFSFTDNKGVPTAATDSLVHQYNLKLQRLFKVIKVDGVKGLDTISLYNEEGIEASEKFDIKKNYTIEISIPIALVRNQINTANTFAYRITISGGKMVFLGEQGARVEGGSSNAEEAAKMRDDVISAVNRMSTVYNASTDFSGEYTLAK